MNIRKLQEEVNGLVIKNPCAANWDDMEGDATVRFCGSCKKNVHNLTTMSPEQLAATLELRKLRPMCVFMARNENGAVVIDNCPTFLRKSRDRVRAYAYSALLTMTWSLALSASGQGLVGAPVDSRYGTAECPTPFLWDFGYDTARDISRAVTALSVLLVLLWPYSKRSRLTRRRLALEILSRLAIPICVHLAGTFVINNYGGLGGGGI